MSRIDDLRDKYIRFISVPWPTDIAPDQRVIFCVYDPVDELKMRRQYSRFDLETRNVGHEWIAYDFTDSFYRWMLQLDYAEEYFEDPSALNECLGDFSKKLVSDFKAFIDTRQEDMSSTVVALTGIGSLFGFQTINGLVSQLAPIISGRLLVFFPGTYENNNYRLLDGYDGWNYRSVPITATF